MKKVNIFLVLLCVALLFGGCRNFRFASSIEDLIAPVTPSGENLEVQKALNEYCTSGYSTKVPSSGNYTTAFIYNDLDNDGSEEAVAFYEPGDRLGSVNMAVIKKGDKNWSVVDNIESDGSDVSSVDFSDLDNNGVTDIIVSWNVISKAKATYIDVYYKNSEALTYSKVDDSIVADEFICVDANDDECNELLVFSTGSAAESPYSELYSFADGYKDQIGYTKLDSSIISFERISVGTTDAGTSIYVDALRSDGSSMVTEFLYWSDFYNSIVSPIYSYSTGRTAQTTRQDLVLSRDIDGDGVIEIPTTAEMYGLPSQLKAEDWVEYKSTIFTHKAYSVSCKKDAYLILITDDEFKDLIFAYDEDKHLMSAYKDDQICYSIMSVNKSAYESNANDYSSYEKIFENSGYVYLALINGESGYKADDLSGAIRAYV